MSKVTSIYGTESTAYVMDSHVTTHGVIRLIVEIVHDERFDHREWSICNAELFESLAERIREGYAGEAGAPKDSPP